MNLNQSQLVARHHGEQFGYVDITRLAAKLGEETGETIGAVIRHTEGRDGRGWESEIESELMDVLTVAHVLASRIDRNLCDLVDAAAVRFTSRIFTNVKKITAPNKETDTPNPPRINAEQFTLDDFAGVGDTVKTTLSDGPSVTRLPDGELSQSLMGK